MCYFRSGQFEKDCNPDDKGMKVAGIISSGRNTISGITDRFVYFYIYISISRVAYNIT